MTTNTGWPEIIEAVILDLDGTVYRGDAPIPDAIEFIRCAIRAGLGLAFVTNNSTRTRSQIREKLRGMDVDVSELSIINSSWATGAYLSHNFQIGATALVVGEESLRNDIARSGFKVVESGPANIVVVGLDRAITYRTITSATSALLGGAAFVATNADPLLPVGDALTPGAGAIVAAIATASGQTPTIVGKPSADMPKLALKYLGTQPSRTILVGDQVDTDVVSGASAGLFTVLVATGVPTAGQGGAGPDRRIASLLDIPLHSCRRPLAWSVGPESDPQDGDLVGQ